MKKIVPVVFSFFILACSQDESKFFSGHSLPQSSSILIRPASREVKEQVLNYVSRSMKKNGREPAVQWDYNNMVQVQLPGADYYTVVANDISPTGQGSITRAIGFNFDHTDSNITTFVTKLSTVNGRPRIEYFDTDLNRIDGYELYPDENIALRFGTARSLLTCGQPILDCMGHFYTQRGWFSIGLTLVSILEPTVALGVIGGCGMACTSGLLGSGD